MNTTQSSRRSNFRFALLFLAMLLLAGSAMAQKAASTTQAVRAETKTMQVQKVQAPSLSKELQQSLQKGDMRNAVRQCGKACQQDPSSTLSTGENGGTRDYTCNGGNCACAGASDCVAMAPICQEGTLGCNDYGCTCKEGDG